MSLEALKSEVTDDMAAAEIRMMALEMLERFQFELSTIGVESSVQRCDSGFVCLRYDDSADCTADRLASSQHPITAGSLVLGESDVS